MDPIAEAIKRFRERELAGEVSEPFEQIWTVRAACDAIYQLVLGVPLRAVTGEEGETVLGEGHPLATLLERPNPFQTAEELAASWSVYRLLDGCAVGLLYAEGSNLWEPASKRMPTEILTLNPRAVREATRDMRTGIVSHYDVTVGQGAAMRVPAASLVMVRGFNPRDLQAGSSPIKTLAAAMSADLQADAYAAALLRNDGTPGVVLKVDDTSDATMKALRESWDDRHKGASKRGKTAILPRGVDLVPAPAQTSKDMGLTAQRERLVQATKALFGVTDFELGEIADYNRANAEAARAWLWANTILPTLERIENTLWTQVFRHVDGGKAWAKFDTSKVAALAPVMDAKATTAATLINAGFGGQEVSDKLGLGLAYVGIEEPETEPEPAAPAAPPPAESKSFGIIVRTKQAPISSAAAIRLNQAWRRHAELKLGKRWRKFTAERYAETVAAARGITDVGALGAADVDALLKPVDVWRDGAKAAAEAGLKGLGKPLSDNLALELGGFRRVEVGQSTFAPFAARRTAQMIQVGEKLRRRIRSAIVGDLQEGTVSDIEATLQARFGGLLPSNAAVVARTEAGMFQNDVRQSLMIQDGIDQKQWTASMDEYTRETHRAIDGEIVDVSARFSNGLLHPCESGAPASEVIQCRCVALPRIKERE